MKLGEKNKHWNKSKEDNDLGISPRSVTDITRPDPLSLVELGGGERSNSGKIRKNEVFVTYERIIRS